MNGPGREAEEFDAAGLARRLLAGAHHAALATLDAEMGGPVATLVNVAPEPDGQVLLLVSGLALHTRNLLADPRCSLLIAPGGKGDALAHARLTLIGRAARAEGAGALAHFLALHPKARLYAGLPDFRLLRIVADIVHLNGGFARAARLSPADLASTAPG